jgi:hypothetical protein
MIGTSGFVEFLAFRMIGASSVRWEDLSTLNT